MGISAPIGFRELKILHLRIAGMADVPIECIRCSRETEPSQGLRKPIWTHELRWWGESITNTGRNFECHGVAGRRANSKSNTGEAGT